MAQRKWHSEEPLPSVPIGNPARRNKILFIAETVKLDTVLQCSSANERIKVSCGNIVSRTTVAPADCPTHSETFSARAFGANYGAALRRMLKEGDN